MEAHSPDNSPMHEIEMKNMLGTMGVHLATVGSREVADRHLACQSLHRGDSLDEKLGLKLAHCEDQSDRPRS